MFDVGFSELVVIGIVALLVLGPQRLPEVARTAGRWMGRLRRLADEVKNDFERELQSQELAELRKLKQDIEQTREILEQPLDPTAHTHAELPAPATSNTNEGNAEIIQRVPRMSEPAPEPLGGNVGGNGATPRKPRKRSAAGARTVAAKPKNGADKKL